MDEYNKKSSEKEKRICYFLKCVPFLELTDKAIVNTAKRFCVSEDYFRSLIAQERKSRGEVHND